MVMLVVCAALVAGCSGVDRAVEGKAAVLRGPDLPGAKLSYANFKTANLRASDLRAADLRYAALNGAHLQGADLREADLRGADLTGANLDGCDLRGARGLTQEHLRAARWRSGAAPKVDPHLAAAVRSR